MPVFSLIPMLQARSEDDMSMQFATVSVNGSILFFDTRLE